MAQDILSLFVYMLFLTLAVTVVNSVVAVVQLIEDLPAVRKKIWLSQNRTIQHTHDTCN